MKTQNKLLIATLTATVFAGSAYAGGHNAGRHTYRDSAKVIDVTPIYRQIEVSTPREECWQEQVTYEAPAGRSSATPVILGSIIGGVIGNQIGDGRGRKIATVAGTLLGASIGADNAHANTRYAPTTATEQRCRVVQESYTEQRTIGYRVKYRYRGEIFETRMDRDPGDRIPVAVTVTPVF
ncbi:MAG: glycine zipper 2TM domain-containing protein [Proteobacteria bacterium]|nr:MAG: glycine zipper 2TM domain-containing protein [Pseudomonadota bacterium]